MKVLVIDDHAAMRQTIKCVLNAPGLLFIEGADGKEAVRLFCAHQPDWVLMDLMLPEMDGIQATQAIRRHCPTARVIVVTNYNDANLREAATSAGACGFVPKDNLCELRRFLTPPLASDGNGPSAPYPLLQKNIP